MKFNLFTTFFLVSLCTVFITSCNKDNENNFDNSLLGGKRLSSINENDDTYFTFEYTNEKLTKIVLSGDDDYGNLKVQRIISFTYLGKIVKVVGILNLQLNKDGFVKSISIGDSIRNFTTCEYSNGYLTKVNFDNPVHSSDNYYYNNDPNSSDYYYYYYYYNDPIEIKYDKNYNIISAKYTVLQDEYQFTMSNYPSKGINFFFLGHCFGADKLGLLWSFYYAGLLGKNSPNLPSNIKRVEKEGNIMWNRNFSYTFDKDGYVTALTAVTSGSGFSPYRYTCTFTYE